jgi:hypothetical protein
MHHTRARLHAALLAAGLAGTLCLGACAGNSARRAHDEPVMLAPGAELAPLAFMAGRWVVVEDNGIVQEEHWMAPRGRSMMAMFRRVLPDGRPAFHEIASLTSEDGQILLRLRHFHGKLEARENESEAMVMRLDVTGPGTARFAGVTNTRGVASVTYRAVGADRLACDIAFDPASGRQDETITMTRLGASR